MNFQYDADLKNVIMIGDALANSQRLASNSVNCIVSSPPYYGLRSYLDENSLAKSKEIGLEDTPEAYIDKLVVLFRELRRVLRDDGTFWLNLGDSYWANRSQNGELGGMGETSVDARANHARAGGKTHSIYKPKDLMMIPARVALALQSDGWYLRSQIIWHKPNAMPQSMTDRPTNDYELVFLLTKSPNYFYDADAIREPHKQVSIERAARGRNRTQKYSDDSHLPSSVRPNTINGERPYLGYERIEEAVANGETNLHPKGRNKRAVWSIATAASKDHHFAVMPSELVKNCILAGCPEGGIVLDPFGGSGTVGAVAVSLNRYYLLMELNTKYIQIAQARIRQSQNANPFYDTKLDNGKVQRSLFAV